MAERTPHDMPSEAEAEDGHVFAEGPDGIAHAMTPDAAAETGERLKRAAAEAHEQRRSTPHRP
jgi:hypothetical protein